MIVGYARLSGAIGLTDEEKGVRGLWLEKRIALMKALHLRGHSLRIITRLTKPTAKDCETSVFPGCDVLWIEFGGLNKQFYGEDIEAVLKIANDTRKPKVFFSDDPDLPMLWDEVANKKEWAALYNCRHPERFPKHPRGVPAFDLPISGFQEMQTPTAAKPENENFVYVGRPNGRLPAVKKLIAQQAPVRFYAKPGEYDALGVRTHAPPEQALRAQFYQKALGCLTLADAKHKELGFRTGRAYHAVMAGSPAVVERDHWALLEEGFLPFSDGNHLRTIKKEWLEDLEKRRTVALEQQAALKALNFKALQALAAVGL